MIDMKSVDLDLLLALDALLDHGNVTRAAEHMGIGQPALSARLARLRNILGDPLLVPSESGRGMVATPRALALHQPLKAALHTLADVVAPPPAFDPRNAERHFIVAASDRAVASFGLPLLELLSQRAGPGLRLSFIHPQQASMAQQMEQGPVDLLFGTDHLMPPTARSVALREERFVMVQRKGHPRGTAPLDLDTYCALDHVLVSPSGTLRGYVDEQLDQIGRSRRVGLGVHQFALALLMVRNSDRVTTVPIQYASRCLDQVDVFDLPFVVPGFTMYLAWHPRLHAEPAHQWLRQQIVDMVKSL